MKIGREIQLECPRCLLLAVRRPGRQTRCTHCGAELAIAHTSPEEWIRTYLHGSDLEGLQVLPLAQPRLDQAQGMAH